MFPVTQHGNPLPASTRHKVKGSTGSQEWNIPAEVPVAFVYNRRNYAVMMATPEDLIDFAIGFSLTERIIKSPKDIESLDINLSDKGVDFRIDLSSKTLEKFDLIQRRRNMVGSASCGLCGLENADTLFEVLPKVSEEKVQLEPSAIMQALEALPALQTLNILTKSVHAAAWVASDGNILNVREDVGRHNAVDKLLGAIAKNETSTTNGFLLVSSRCSYEIVEKAARLGVRAIFSISSPTGYALRKANEANLSIFTRLNSGVVQL